MTFQTEIDAALAKPVDQELVQEAKNIALHCGIIFPERLLINDVLYTLLLRIRDLEAQVEKGNKIASEMKMAATSARYNDWEGCDTGDAIAGELENFADKLKEITK